MSIFNTVGSLFSSNVTPSSADTFKDTLSKHQGIARTNRFAIFMSPPEAAFLNLDIQSQALNLLSGNSFRPSSLINDPRDMAILCESASLPGRQVTTTEFQAVRQTLKIPSGLILDDVSFTFHLTNDYYIKKMFDNWINAVLDIKNYRTPYLKDYARDVVIQQLNQQNLPVYGIKLKDAFPITLNTIELSNADLDNTTRFTVTFTYREHEPENGLRSALSGVQNAIGGITRLL